MPDNPLLSPPDTPFGVPPFHLIRPEHFVPAFEEAMAEHLREVDAIAHDPASPTFANTVEAMERSGRKLTYVGNVFGNLVVSLGGPALEEVDRVMSPRLAQHSMNVSLNPGVFARVGALHDRIGELGLQPDARRLLERTHLGLVRSGAGLDDAAKARLTAISERLATLHTQFGQNVLHDEKEWHLLLAEADLDGLPPSVRASARGAAQERGLEGYAVTLSRSRVEPFLKFSARRDLREAAWRAWAARGAHPGPHDNRALIPEILTLRRERAQLLGAPDFATFRLEDSMAASPDAAETLLRTVWNPAKHKAERERARLEQQARAEGFNGAIEPWDWRYWAEKVRQADHALDEEALKPYFVLADMERAAFDTAGRLFGLRFLPRPDVELYHPDVRAWEVRDDDGHVGVFLADPYARPDKRSGAWMSSYRDQETLDGPVSPIIVNNNNFARAEPTLLSFDDAETLFHEFGHALHGLLSRVRYPGQSGTSVRRDFVEFPSQVFEHWFSLPDTLRTYARHHQTGEPIGDETVRKLLAARNFNGGYDTVSYTSSALIDLALHRYPDPASLDVERFEAEFAAAEGVPGAVGLRHRPSHFQHLFAGSGYAAGYYSYMWSEVLDADGFDAFKEAGNPFDPATAARLRAVLSAGDTRDPMELYTEFRGRAPDAGALLRGRELVE